MLTIEHIYWLVGAFLTIACLLNLRDRRWSMAAFWGVLACTFLLGDFIQRASTNGSRWPAQTLGVGVIALGLLATNASRVPTHARGGDANLAVSASQAAESTMQILDAQRLGNRLFVPALMIPLATLALVLGAKYLRWGATPLIGTLQLTLTSLGIACVLALIVALRTTRATPAQALSEGRRLLDTLGCVAVLPMLLATLGSVFAATGVGDVIAAIVGALIPVDNRIACLAAFALGMVLFTIIMGNAFAAFPVLMAGIGLPLLILRHSADPAVLGSIGMLTGYCGTLLTPMAANFNIVPAVLLELPDQYGVIRAQLPTALALLAVNFFLMWLWVFR